MTQKATEKQISYIRDLLNVRRGECEKVIGSTDSLFPKHLRPDEASVAFYERAAGIDLSGLKMSEASLVIGEIKNGLADYFYKLVKKNEADKAANRMRPDPFGMDDEPMPMWVEYLSVFAPALEAQR